MTTKQKRQERNEAIEERLGRMDIEFLSKTAYEAYRNSVTSTDPMPTWRQLEPGVRKVWHGFSTYIAKTVLGNLYDLLPAEEWNPNSTAWARLKSELFVRGIDGDQDALLEMTIALLKGRESVSVAAPGPLQQVQVCSQTFPLGSWKRGTAGDRCGLMLGHDGLHEPAERVVEVSVPPTQREQDLLTGGRPSRSEIRLALNMLRDASMEDVYEICSAGELLEIVKSLGFNPLQQAFPVPNGDVEALIADREKVYGDSHTGHEEVGEYWRTTLESYFGVKLPGPIPADIVLLMLVLNKVHRAARPNGRGWKDSYDDIVGYATLAEKSAGRYGLTKEKEKH